MTDSLSITEQIASRIQQQGFKLPVFNQVALELQQALSKDISMAEAEALILKDQAITSELLRVANSAFFSGLSKLDSIKQALVRLGTEQVLSIVMLSAQKQAFKAKNPFLKKTMERLWQHASASAGGCRWLAVKYGYSDQKEMAFLAGLLHDLGSLVILKVLDEVCQENPDMIITDAVMTELIKALHCEYGFKVMQSWELPELYCTIARDHHLAQADSKNVLLLITRLVDAACTKVGIGLDDNPDMILEALEETHAIGVKAVHLAELEIQLEDYVDQFA
jgi:HD-like signal output (HDOD) protein